MGSEGDQAVRGVAARRSRICRPYERRSTALVPTAREKVKERGWQPDDDTWDQLMRLNEIRDTFMHYTSGGLI